MSKTSKIADLLAEPPNTLRQVLIAEYDSITIARARSISWDRIARSLGYGRGVVQRSWSELERQILAGDLPRPGTVSVGSPAQSGSSAQVGSPAQTSSPAQVDAPPPMSAREKLRAQLAANRTANPAERSGIEQLRAAGVDVSHL